MLAVFVAFPVVFAAESLVAFVEGAAIGPVVAFDVFSRRASVASVLREEYCLLHVTRPLNPFWAVRAFMLTVSIKTVWSSIGGLPR